MAVDGVADDLYKPIPNSVYVTHAVVVTIGLALLIFGILGMTHTGVFANMGAKCAKALTGIGGTISGFYVLGLLGYSKKYCCECSNSQGFEEL